MKTLRRLKLTYCMMALLFCLPTFPVMALDPTPTVIPTLTVNSSSITRGQRHLIKKPGGSGFHLILNQSSSDGSYHSFLDISTHQVTDSNCKRDIYGNGGQLETAAVCYVNGESPYWEFRQISNFTLNYTNTRKLVDAAETSSGSSKYAWVSLLDTSSGSPSSASSGSDSSSQGVISSPYGTFEMHGFKDQAPRGVMFKLSPPTLPGWHKLYPHGTETWLVYSHSNLTALDIFINKCTFNANSEGACTLVATLQGTSNYSSPGISGVTDSNGNLHLIYLSGPNRGKLYYWNSKLTDPTEIATSNASISDATLSFTPGYTTTLAAVWAVNGTDGIEVHYSLFNPGDSPPLPQSIDFGKSFSMLGVTSPSSVDDAGSLPLLWHGYGSGNYEAAYIDLALYLTRVVPSPTASPTVPPTSTVTPDPTTTPTPTNNKSKVVRNFPSSLLPERPVLTDDGHAPDSGAGTIGRSSMAVSSENNLLVFASKAADIQNNANTADNYHVYLRKAASPERISSGEGEHGIPLEVENSGRSLAVNADGSKIVYHSRSPDGLFSIKLYDSGTKESRNITQYPGQNTSPSISGDGNIIAFQSRNSMPESNGFQQIYRYSASSEETLKCLTCPGNGDSSFPTVSRDGRFIVFSSKASITTGDGNDCTDSEQDIFLYDNFDPVHLKCLTPGLNGDASLPSISGSGSFVVFRTAGKSNQYESSNGKNQIYLWTSGQSKFELISRDINGVPGNEDSGFGEISLSDDGNLVVFSSLATNLNGGIKGLRNIFLHDRSTGEKGKTFWDHGRTGLISRKFNDDLLHSDSDSPLITSDGKRVFYISTSPEIAIDSNQDSNGVADIISAPVLPLPNLISDGRNQPQPEAPRQVVTVITSKKGKKTRVVELIFQLFKINRPYKDKLEDFSKETIRYEFSIRRKDKKGKVIRNKAKKNKTTVKDLAPGTYLIRYRVEKRKGTSTKKTPWSREVKFNVPK